MIAGRLTGVAVGRHEFGIDLENHGLKVGAILASHWLYSGVRQGNEIGRMIASLGRILLSHAARLVVPSAHCMCIGPVYLLLKQ